MKQITDKRRLDYLTSQMAEIQCDISSKALEDGEVWYCQPAQSWHKTPRHAIDDAIRAETKMCDRS